MSYYVVRSPWARPAAHAAARRYSEIVGAVVAMGDGVVYGDGGHLAAFHERHLPIIERQYAPTT